MTDCSVCGFQTEFLTAKKDRFGQEYFYMRCPYCSFLFDRDLVLDTAKLETKVGKVYNQIYFESIDSGWKMRGDAFLKLMHAILRVYRFLTFKKNISLLDYGGGNGYITSKVNSKYDTFYYDKYEKPSFLGNYKVLEKPQKTDVVCAVELIEHLTDIEEWDFLKSLQPDVFMFTTCLSDMVLQKDLVHWIYLNPDAGHTALYSIDSLSLLAKKYGYIYVFFPNITCHIFIKNNFLSNVGFAKIEYFFYNIARKIKNMQ